jgi:hypothetical protein
VLIDLLGGNTMTESEKDEYIKLLISKSHGQRIIISRLKREAQASIPKDDVQPLIDMLERARSICKSFGLSATSESIRQTLAEYIQRRDMKRR